MVIEKDHLSLREMAQNSKMSHESIRTVLVDVLGMRCVAREEEREKKGESEGGREREGVRGQTKRKG